MVIARRRKLQEWWHEVRPERNISLAWIGQAGFLLRLGQVKVIIDPYLSDSLAEKYRGTHFPHRRMMEVPIKPSLLTGTDLLLCTHEHTDHLDGVTVSAICAANSSLSVVVPRFSASTAIVRGVPPERLVTMDAGERWRSPLGVTVEAIPAAHETAPCDRYGNHKYLGYRMEHAGTVVYHSGDTVPFAPLEDRLARENRIDLALFPSNGRDEVRTQHGIPGNMTAEEAIVYHRRFSVSHTILHHFGMFDFNTRDPEELAMLISRESLNEEVFVPKIGTVYELQ